MEAAAEMEEVKLRCAVVDGESRIGRVLEHQSIVLSSENRKLKNMGVKTQCQDLINHVVYTKQGIGRDEHLAFYEPTLHLDETVRSPRWMG